MTKQEYWELLQVAAGDGTFPSIDGPAGCMYRADKTAGCKNRCAVGLLIPDEKYNPDMEGKLCTSITLKPHFDVPEGMTLTQLRDVQAEHDCIARDWDKEKFLSNVRYIFEPTEVTAK